MKNIFDIKTGYAFIPIHQNEINKVCPNATHWGITQEITKNVSKVVMTVVYSCDEQGTCLDVALKTIDRTYGQTIDSAINGTLLS